MANTPFPPFYHQVVSRMNCILQMDCGFSHPNLEGCDAKREVADEPCPGNSPTLTREENVGASHCPEPVPVAYSDPILPLIPIQSCHLF